ncbi:MAG TPA: hypothetical protein VG816_01215 [Solirubrobacterales bacterium]|nr:hypothetical protein [Solirubrobacterales bacterium]
MPFHVELSTGIKHARAFNLSREQLMAQVVAPWLEDLPVELGEQTWLPAESGLKILEGPHLDGPDLAFGRGWSSAERSSENVTRRELAAAPAPEHPDAFVIETEQPDAAIGKILESQAATPVAWAEARERIDGRDPEIAAVILVVRPKP